MPLRRPEKVITLGKPAAAQASTDFLIFSMHGSWFALSLKPTVSRWLGVIALIRPYFLRIGKSFGIDQLDRGNAHGRRSSAISVSSGIGLKHQEQTDCLMRPLVTILPAGPWAVRRRGKTWAAAGSAAAAARAPAAPPSRWRRDMFFDGRAL